MKFQKIFQAIFKRILVNDDWDVSYEIALKWLSQDLADDKYKWLGVKPLPEPMLTQIYVTIWRL